MNNEETDAQLIRWTPAKRLVAYLAPFAVVGAMIVFLAHGLQPISWLACWIYAAVLWSFAFFGVALWSRIRPDAIMVSKRTLRDERFRRDLYGSYGNQNEFDSVKDRWCQ